MQAPSWVLVFSTAPAFADLAPDESGYGGLLTVAHERSALDTSCMVVRRRDYVAAGGMDETWFPFVHGGVDLCLKLRAAGHRLVVTPHARVVRAGAPRPIAVARQERELQRLRAKWGEVLADDPTYSPMLGLDGPPYTSLAWPLRNAQPRRMTLPVPTSTPGGPLMREHDQPARAVYAPRGLGVHNDPLSTDRIVSVRGASIVMNQTKEIAADPARQEVLRTLMERGIGQRKDGAHAAALATFQAVAQATDGEKNVKIEIARELRALNRLIDAEEILCDVLAQAAQCHRSVGRMGIRVPPARQSRRRADGVSGGGDESPGSSRPAT